MLWLVAGCASLPDYASPRGKLIAEEVDLSTLVPYRELSRDDFQAAGPPRELGEDGFRLAAYTCASVRPDPGGSIAGSRRVEGGRQVFRARADSLVYRAYLDPACSWWNESVPNPPDYVLQHEQIHFALFELEARRLNHDLSREAWAAEAGTLDEAVAALQAKIQVRLAQALESALAVNRAFDEETSMGYRPGKQSEWWARTMSELDALGPGVRAPATQLPRNHAECVAAGGEREPEARGGRCFLHTTPQRNRAEYVLCREEGGVPRMVGRGTTRAAAGQSHVCTLIFEPGGGGSALSR